MRKNPAMSASSQGARLGLRLCVCLLLCAVLAPLCAKEQGRLLSKPATKPSSLSAPASWCARGDGIACLYVAQGLLFGDGKRSDILRAKVFYHRACLLGVRNACDELAKIALPPGVMFARYWRLWAR